MQAAQQLVDRKPLQTERAGSEQPLHDEEMQVPPFRHALIDIQQAFDNRVEFRVGVPIRDHLVQTGRVCRDGIDQFSSQWLGARLDEFESR